jgi:hypothetical protein
MNANPRKSRSARIGGLIAGLNRSEELQEFRSCRMEGRIPRDADVPTKVPKTPRNHHHGNNPVHTRSVRRWTFNIVNGILRARATPGQRLRLRRSGEILFERIANGSVVSWRHINLLGGCDFSGRKARGFGPNQAPKIGGLKAV